MLRIVLTGGGSAGHVTPNIALIEALRQQGWSMEYIGGIDGVEKHMIEPLQIVYRGIHCGKLRRYFSWQNFLDPWKILLGIAEAYRLLWRFHPHIVFSKGGFVAFPVVVAAKLLKIPVVAHESDFTPGLANRLSLPFVNKICVTFEAVTKHFKYPEKVIHTGTPLRESVLHGDRARGLVYCGFNDTQPCILVMGGGQGAQVINQCIRAGLDEWLKTFQIIHLCGVGKIDLACLEKPFYKQIEYASEELPDLLAASDLIISRAGANSLYEILALKKPHILIPLSKASSRGDQIENANYFQAQGVSEVIQEEELSVERLRQSIAFVMQHKQTMIQKMQTLNIQSATTKILELLQKTATLK